VALEKLQESNKELDMFIYRASHDLRGPILRIQGLTMITQRELDAAAQKLNIHRIELTAIEMGRLLSKLLNIHDIFKEELEHSKVSFDKLFEDVTKTLQPLIWENTDFIQLNIQSGVNFHSDHYLLKIILENLIENAIVFRKNTTDLLVKVNVTTAGNFLVMNIEDNGVGISDQIKDQVFNMFYRGSEKSIGSGLGLYLVKKAIEKLQGEIILESSPLQYTNITVRLPISPVVRI
jgi:signal transduction histidine kinase